MKGWIHTWMQKPSDQSAKLAVVQTARELGAMVRNAPQVRERAYSKYPPLYTYVHQTALLFCVLQLCNWNLINITRVGAGIRYCTKSMSGIRKGIKVNNHTIIFLKSNTQLLYIYIYITIVLNALKESNFHLKTCQVFVGSFMKLGDSLKFFNYSKPTVLWIWIVFKYPDSMVLWFWIFFKDPKMVVLWFLNFFTYT